MVHWPSNQENTDQKQLILPGSDYQRSRKQLVANTGGDKRKRVSHSLQVGLKNDRDAMEISMENPQKPKNKSTISPYYTVTPWCTTKGPGILFHRQQFNHVH